MANVAPEEGGRSEYPGSGRRHLRRPLHLRNPDQPDRPLRVLRLHGLNGSCGISTISDNGDVIWTVTVRTTVLVAVDDTERWRHERGTGKSGMNAVTEVVKRVPERVGCRPLASGSSCSRRPPKSS